MTKIYDDRLLATVRAAYQFSVDNGGSFNRASASGYMKLFGFQYDSKQLSDAVRTVAQENNITGTRDTVKSQVYRELGETIRGKEDLANFLQSKEIDVTEKELAKYARVLEVVQRIIAKYED